MDKKHILVVEDDEAIQELIVYNLHKEGFEITAVFTGEDALKKMQTEHFSCILLDIMLPGIDGLSVCTSIRKKNSYQNIPIIMATAKGEESDIIKGLELGADDYIVKPFSPRVLIARIKSVLRRQKIETPKAEEIVSIHGLTINPGRHEVCVDEERIELTNMEFRMLHFLALHPGWVFTRYQIVNGIRGEGYPVTDRAVDVLIVGLRKKLGESGNVIETVRGVGYRLREEESDA